MPHDLQNSPRHLLMENFDDANYLDFAEKRAARAKMVSRLRLLWGHKEKILRITGAGLLLFLVLAFVIPRKFESTTRLMPPDQPNAGMAVLGMLTGKGAPGAVGALADEFLGLKNTGDLFMGILKSRSVQDDLITKFNLRQVYHEKKWEDARDKLSDKTDISQDRKSGIIALRVTDRNPQRAAAMAQEYIDALNRVVTHLNTSSAHRERVFLEERLGQVQTDLEAAEKDFSQFASKNTALDIKEQGRAMISAGAALEGQMIAAQTELEGLRQIYTDNNVRVRTLEARIEELRRETQKIGGSATQPSSGNDQDNGGQQGSAQKGGQQNTSDQLYPSIRQLPILGVTWADLYRRAAVQEKVFETLTQEYELAKVEEAKETPSVKVLDSPNVPEKGFPPRFWFVFVGTVLSMIAGIALVVGGARWREVDPHDPGKLLAIEVFEGMKTLTISNGSQNGSANGGWWGRLRKHSESDPKT
jgi:capsule polysaccharide export protein KpsE/RkpR